MAKRRLHSNERTTTLTTLTGGAVLGPRPGRQAVMVSHGSTGTSVSAHLSWVRVPTAVQPSEAGATLNFWGGSPLIFRREDWGCMIDGTLFAFNNAALTMDIHVIESFWVEGEDDYL